MDKIKITHKIALKLKEGYLFELFFLVLFIEITLENAHFS